MYCFEDERSSMSPMLAWVINRIIPRVTREQRKKAQEEQMLLELQEEEKKQQQKQQQQILEIREKQLKEEVEALERAGQAGEVEFRQSEH
jgi:hypothetical protein